MPIYVHRTGTTTTKQALFAINLQGSQTTAQVLTVPGGVSNLIALISTLAFSTTAAATGCVVFVRISGQGITQGGEQDIVIGGVSAGFTTPGGYGGTSGPNYIPVSIGVTQNAALTLNGDTDTGGTMSTRLDVGLTLVFQ